MIAIPKYKDGTYEELLTFYPEFYTHIKEMTAIVKVVAEQIDRLMELAQKTFDDSNLLTASEDVISFYESIIGIKYSGARKLEERRRLVLVYYNIFGKVSATKIKNAVAYYTGANISINFDEKDANNNYILYIDFKPLADEPVKLDDIKMICRKIIPAHLQIGFKIDIKDNVKNGYLYSGALAKVKNKIRIGVK